MDTITASSSFVYSVPAEDYFVLTAISLTFIVGIIFALIKEAKEGIR